MRPIAAILPSLIPTSATYDDVPVPSTTRPFLMTTSKLCSAAAVGFDSQIAAITAMLTLATRDNWRTDFMHISLLTNTARRELIAASPTRWYDTTNVNQASDNCEQQASTVQR